MKAIQLVRPGHFATIELPEPAAPGPGEALVRVHRIGICGTDYSGFQGKMPFYSYPRIPGHELGVEIEALGPGTQGLHAGDRCAVEPYINCERCEACLAGHTNCCVNLQVLGVHTDGGMRPRFLVPARKLHPAPHLAPEQAALVETLAIGCHAVNRGSCARGETVLVIGTGPIGLAVLEFTRLTGCRTLALDMNPRRLEFVRNHMGVAETIQAAGDGSELRELERLTDGRLARCVIDATGNHLSMGRALQYVGFAGRLVYVGITTQEISFGHPLMHRRELTLFASRNALPADFTRIIHLIESGRIDTRPWITHHASLDDVPTRFPDWLKPETGVVKAIVEVPNP